MVMAPITSSSRNIGTVTAVRAPPSSTNSTACGVRSRYAAVVLTSATRTACLVRIAVVIARCGLLLERFLEIARPGLHLLEQLDILDGDHRLVGEGLQQLDMLGRECPGFLARDRDDPGRTRVAVHRHKQQAAKAARSPRSLRRQ